VKFPTAWAVESDEVLASRNCVEKAVRRLMDEGNEGEKVRERARELSEKAHRAMQEGGSSYENVKVLVQKMHTIKHNA